MAKVFAETLVWDSQFFNKKIGRWIRSANDSDSAAVVEEFDVVVSKVLSNDLESIDFLGGVGFSYCEGELLFSCELSGANKNNIDYSLATRLDESRLLHISKDLFSYSRFREPWFSIKEKNEFYARWISNAINGQFDDVCLMDLSSESEIRGFVTLRKCSETVVIGLLGVAERYQGQGVGRRLLDISKDWAQKQNCKYIDVATQSSNLVAINLYERNGFYVAKSSVWMYRSNRN